MAAPKGHPKYAGAGRVAGVPNKNKAVCREIIELALGKSLPDKIAELAEQIRDPKDKAQILSGLMPYCYPKLATVEVVSTPEEKVIELEKNIDGVFDAAIDAHLELRGEARSPKATLQR